MIFLKLRNGGKIESASLNTNKIVKEAECL